jgi:hypothetical protein
MAALQFATCERDTALRYLAKLYPSRIVEDAPHSAKQLLDLIEADIVRVADPAYHGGQILPGTNWDESKRNEVVTVCAAFHQRT